MIGSLSNFAEALVLDSIFGRIPNYSWPGTLYFALFNNIPDDAGANGLEVSSTGTSYARKAISNSSANFDPTPSTGASKGLKRNKTAIVFPTATADCGEIKGGGVYDAATGGNLLWLWEWSSPRTIASGDTMRIPVNELEFTFNASDAVNADCILSFAMQKAFLDAFFGSPIAPTIPTELYAALMTAVPSADEATSQAVTVSVTTTNTDATVTTADTTLLKVGMTITGTGIPGATTVASITNATTFELRENATATGTVTATATEATGGGAGTEITALSNYSRALIANDATRFPAYAASTKTNGQQIVWPQAGEAWSSIVGVALYTAPTSGTLIAKVKLESTHSWSAGDQPRIAAGALPIHAD